MAKVIVITSGKGGVGKTTTTSNIGVGLALKGKKVLMIDTDIGLRNLDRNNFRVVLPSFGEATSVNAENASFIARLMSAYEGRDVEVRDGRIYDGETEIVSYRFAQPYYWVLADNREMGTDSRSFGGGYDDQGEAVLNPIQFDAETTGWVDADKDVNVQT